MVCVAMYGSNPKAMENVCESFAAILTSKTGIIYVSRILLMIENHSCIM